MAITTKVIIDKIKPLLSESPITHVGIDLSLNDAARVTVEFMLTKEMIKAMQEEGED